MGDAQIVGRVLFRASSAVLGVVGARPPLSPYVEPPPYFCVPERPPVSRLPLPPSPLPPLAGALPPPTRLTAPTTAAPIGARLVPVTGGGAGIAAREAGGADRRGGLERLPTAGAAPGERLRAGAAARPTTPRWGVRGGGMAFDARSSNQHL